VPYAYPIFLDVSGRFVLIVGGGAVAARKARGLIEAGAARIRCVSLDFCLAMPDAVERLQEPYRAGHLESVSMVFAATNSRQVNETIVRDAHARNLLVNRADLEGDEAGDFTIPAKLRRGQVMVTVSAGSPALSAEIRDRLRLLFDPRWEQMAEAMVNLRPLVKASAATPEDRHRIFRELAGEEAFHVLDDRGPTGLRDWLLGRHPELRT
jgi:precorrin-2 dehydrogenase/sirohydrochlorin ferrochelatase